MNVAFRTDASLQIGTGHVMRCLALAGVLAEQGVRCHFITRKNAGPLLELIKVQGHKVYVLADSAVENKASTAHADWLEGDLKRDAEETRKILRDIGAQWLIVDHYALDAKWESAAKPDDIRLMAIDDLADRHHVCDVLLDQNLGHSAKDYASLVPSGCRCLIGPRFALLRPEFAAKRTKLKELPGGTDNWLACVGGLDPYDILGKIISAWEKLSAPKPSLTLALGTGSPNVDTLKQRTANLKDIALHVSGDMAGLMASASLFIGTTGGISWERCCLGLPALMGMVAENQRSNLEALAHRGTGIDIGDWRKVSVDTLADNFKNILRQPDLLQKMATQSAQLVDGKGAERVAVALRHDKVELRKATSNDAEMALVWRNAEETRRYSFDSKVIAVEAHLTWWAHSLVDIDRDLLVAQIGNNPAGVLRLDYKEGDVRVSIYIDPDLAGVGLGRAILKAGAEWCREKRPKARQLLADIMPENKASQAAFQKAGFVFQNLKWVYIL